MPDPHPLPSPPDAWLFGTAAVLVIAAVTAILWLLVVVLLHT